jgi:hypothetical protein
MKIWKHKTFRTLSPRPHPSTVIGIFVIITLVLAFTACENQVMIELLEPIAPKTVTYSINGGTGTTPAAQKVDAGDNVTLPGGSGFSKSGYYFGGWNTNTDGTGTSYSAGSSYTPSKTVTLYAKWDTFWWTWVSDKNNGDEYTSTAKVKIIPTPDNTGCDVTVTGTPNAIDRNWATQIDYNYTATVGKRYKVTWKWTADSKEFRYVAIRYTQQKDYKNDSYYQIDTDKNRLTIPTIEETKTYYFTMPDNCFMYFTFQVGADTGSFKIRDFKIVEVESWEGVDNGSPLTITLGHNQYESGGTTHYNWDYVLDIPSSVTGGKITAGDKYTFIYSFSSKVAITSALNIQIVDNSEAVGWKALSTYEKITMTDKPANTTVSGAKTFTVYESASSTDVAANRLHLVVDPASGAASAPTLTFTIFSIKKVSGNNPPIITLERETGDSYDNWSCMYDLSLTGGKITASQTYTLTYSLRSNIAISDLGMVIFDNLSEADNYWKPLSEYRSIYDMPANTTVTGSIDFTATETASSTAAAANRMQISVDSSTLTSQPTLTFYTFSIAIK